MTPFLLLGPGPSPSAVLPGPGWYDAYLLVGGTALFLLGIHMAGEGLRNWAGGRMRRMFGAVARRRPAAFGSGFLITGLLQSSSATTVLLVGMADAGLLTAVQSAAIILGADLGTTVVPQLLAFRVAAWGLLPVAAGFLLVVAGRWQSWRSFGWALCGLGLLFYGRHVMESGVASVPNDPETAARLARMAGSPWASFGAATLLTAVIQSSGATVALAMALAGQGVLDPAAALPIVAGANVGTCATALLAALGAGREGRRVAAIHLGFKLLAALLVMPFAGALGRAAAEWLAAAGAGPERAVASVHTAFNVGMAALFLPVCPWLAGLLARAVPYRRREAERLSLMLSEKLRGQPAVVLMAAERVLADMGRRCAGMLRELLPGFEEDSNHRPELAMRADDELDAIYAALSGALSRLSHARLSQDTAAAQARLMYAAKLFEEVGDLVSRDLGRLVRRRANRGIDFSMEALADLRRVGAAAAEELEAAARAAEGSAAIPARGMDEIEAEHRARLSAHFEQLARDVADAGLAGSTYPDALGVLRDVRRVTADIRAALTGLHGAAEGGRS